LGLRFILKWKGTLQMASKIYDREVKGLYQRVGKRGVGTWNYARWKDGKLVRAAMGEGTVGEARRWAT
jgi:hypothetical protein